METLEEDVTGEEEQTKEDTKDVVAEDAAAHEEIDNKITKKFQ